jgi:8-oxo-dGTP diphosphatase
MFLEPRGDLDTGSSRTHRLGVSVLVHEDGFGPFVISRRREGDQVWDLPGGTVEPGEAPDAAAVREVLEETGLRVTVGSLLALCMKPEQNELVFVFFAQVNGGTLSPTAEKSHHAWVYPHDLVNYDLVARHAARLVLGFQYQTRQLHEGPLMLIQ